MSTRKDKFHYPHPILKTFTCFAQQSQQTQPFAYQNFHTTDPNVISYKLLRSTHIQPLMGSPFSLLLHPLHPNVQVSSFEQKDILECKKCKSIINTTSITKISLLQQKCKYCGFINQCQYSLGQFVDSNIFDIVKLPPKKEQTPRKILFVIEANELLYQKHVWLSILNCLKVLSQNSQSKFNKSISDQTSSSSFHGQQETEENINEMFHFEVGFMFFDSSFNYIVNLSNNQLTMIEPNHFLDESPLTESEIFRPLHYVDWQSIEEIANQIMYSSFRNKYSCMVATLKICNKFAEHWSVESKFFTCSYDLKEKQAKKTKNDIKKEQKELQKAKQLNSRVQIYLMQSKLYGYLCSLGLNDNIFKSYQYNEISENNLYYDIYHHITQQIYFDTQVEISTSQLVLCSNTKFVIPVLTSNTPLILDFNVPINAKLKHCAIGQEQKMLRNQCIQLKLKFQQKQRVITYQISKINCNILNEPYLLNDETFFFIMICKFLMDNNITSIKNSIINKCKSIISRIIKIEEESFGIPKNLTNFFMYSFMMLQHDISDKKNINFIHFKSKFMKQGLQTITKKIYPKVYEFYPQLIPLKFKPKSFLHNVVRLVDNGTFLGIVVGDEVNEKIFIQLFNTKNIDQLISFESIPLLDNPLNQKLQKAILALRQLNELYYLPLKIIDLCSKQYEQFYGNYLYIEDDHRKFFSNCLKN